MYIYVYKRCEICSKTTVKNKDTKRRQTNPDWVLATTGNQPSLS